MKQSSEERIEFLSEKVEHALSDNLSKSGIRRAMSFVDKELRKPSSDSSYKIELREWKDELKTLEESMEMDFE